MAMIGSFPFSTGHADHSAGSKRPPGPRGRGEANGKDFGPLRKSTQQVGTQSAEFARIGLPGQNGLPMGAFTLDTNNSGKYERGKDAVLAFDLNHDGKIDNMEVSSSNAILNSVNNPTLPDGKPNPAFARAAEMGLTGEGPLTAEQIAEAGGRVVIDKGQGLMNEWSTYNVFNFPVGPGKQGSLGAIDPTAGYANVTAAW